MQFHYVLAFLTALSTVLAVPTGHTFMKRSCEIGKCVIALAPTVVGCVGAAAAEGTNLIADAGCLAGAANVVANMPAACDQCLQEFQIEGKLASAEKTVESAADTVKDKVEGIASKLGSLI